MAIFYTFHMNDAKIWNTSVRYPDLEIALMNTFPDIVYIQTCQI